MSSNRISNMSEIQHPNNTTYIKTEMNFHRQLTMPQTLQHNDDQYTDLIVSKMFENNAKLVTQENCTKNCQLALQDLIRICYKLRARQQILLTSFYYVKMFYNKSVAPLDHEVLILSCILLARKFHKSRRVNVRAFLEKVSTAITVQAIIEFQAFVLEALNYEMQPITRYEYLVDIYLKFETGERIQSFCKYLLDLSLLLGERLEERFTQAQFAVSILQLSCFFLEPRLVDSLPIVKLGFDIQVVHQCCDCLFEVLGVRNGDITRLIKHRYKKPKYQEVGRIKFFHIDQLANQHDDKQQQESCEDYRDRKSQQNSICTNDTA